MWSLSGLSNAKCSPFLAGSSGMSSSRGEKRRPSRRGFDRLSKGFLEKNWQSSEKKKKNGHPNKDYGRGRIDMGVVRTFSVDGPD